MFIWLACHLVWPEMQSWALSANFSTKFFHTVHAICTIDFCCFMALSVSLTLAGVTKSAQSKPLGFIFSRIFQLINMKFEMMLKQFKLNNLILLWNEINGIQIIATLFSMTVSENCHIDMCLDVYVPIWFKFSITIDIFEHLDASLSDLDLHLRSQRYKNPS